MRIIISLLIFFLALPANAQCAGENLISAMNTADRNTLETAVAMHPYPSGNLWRAQKGDSIIHVMGTIHLSDGRLAAYLEPLWPIVDTADLILLEATRETMEQLKAAMTNDPSLMFITDGPTLPERLSDEDWALLTKEMSARGIPGFLASKMQPWYVSMMLAIPPCTMAAVAEQNGVDQRIMNRAAIGGVQTRALEPYDVIFSLFGGDGGEDELDILRMSLLNTQGADAMFATMIEAYLSGEHRAIWELGRHQTMQAEGLSQEDALQMYNDLETALLTDRNANWMDVILPATEEANNILIAVGAAHLSGSDGLLSLLESSGYILTRVEGY